MTFSSNKCSGLVGIDQRELEGNTTIGGKEEASSVIPTMHRTSLHGLYIVLY
jgi:hypothetical protein